MNRDNTAFRPGGLFYTEVTLQRWELYFYERSGQQANKTADGTFRVAGLLNGPFFFILIEELNGKTSNDFINVLTPWGKCAFDYYDFRDHCHPVLCPDGRTPSWAPMKVSI